MISCGAKITVDFLPDTRANCSFIIGFFTSDFTETTMFHHPRSLSKKEVPHG